MTQTETYSGAVGRVFFCDPESPFMAGILMTDDGREIRFSGKCAAAEGDRMEVVGVWGEHPKFGRQFDAQSALIRMDESPDAFAHLLATHKGFEGIGPARAKKVADAALYLSNDGEIASALINHPAEIAERSGVSLEIVQKAADLWNDKKSHFDALASLADQGWSTSQAQKIVSTIGENAAALVKLDPYMLIGKIARFGFKTVDTVARHMGIAATDPLRLAAGVAYCLDQIAQNGNTWTTRDDLLAQAIEELRPDTLDGEGKIIAAIEKLIADGHIFVDVSPVTGEEVVADARLAAIEIGVFDKLLAGLSEDVEKLNPCGPRAMAIVPSLNDGQTQAFIGFSHKRFSVISGGAGVGKTYLMDAISEVAEENGLRVEFCAPTGKAARKLSHATKKPARTIHRTLRPMFDPELGTFRFTKNEGDLLDTDLVVVDEISMVDVRLMSSLLAALPSTCRLLIVGDHHQIPSVGPGAILRDLLAARDRYPDAVHVLTEIVRQAGILARNTTAVLDGVVVTQGCESWGIERTERGGEESAAALASNVVEALATAPTPLEPFGRHLDLAWDIQVLTPMRKGPLGTWALNVHLQKLRQRLLGNPPPEPTKEGRSPKPLAGDRVIWIKNDYELDLFNGTQAIVMEFQKGGAMLIHTEDGRDVTVPANKRNLVEVAYAMTIHKSQGSEWPFVILVGSSSHWIMHDRNLLYTGASRASESLTILGDMNGLKHFATERRSAKRQTFGAFLVSGWTPMKLPQPIGAANG